MERGALALHSPLVLDRKMSDGVREAIDRQAFNRALAEIWTVVRAANRAANPEGHNAPVASFGGLDARLLIVGLAPGLKGANRTARPFTGDYAGDLLYETLCKTGFASGGYDKRADDGLILEDCRITNAVKCLPPDNKPVGAEINTCNAYLAHALRLLTNDSRMLALGGIDHRAVIRAMCLRQADYPFSHAAEHEVAPGIMLLDSYHCSRYNTQTGRLTRSMFLDVVKTAGNIANP